MIMKRPWDQERLPNSRALGRRGRWSDPEPSQGRSQPSSPRGGHQAGEAGGALGQQGPLSRRCCQEGSEGVKTKPAGRARGWKLQFGRHLPSVSWKRVFLAGILGHKDPHQPSPYLFLKLNLGKIPNDKLFSLALLITQLTGRCREHPSLASEPEVGGSVPEDGIPTTDVCFFHSLEPRETARVLGPFPLTPASTKTDGDGARTPSSDRLQAAQARHLPAYCSASCWSRGQGITGRERQDPLQPLSPRAPLAPDEALGPGKAPSLRNLSPSARGRDSRE